jgi:hypothetical protein
MTSMEPRSTKRPSIVTGSGTLRSSRPSSDRPKLYSKYSGVQPSASGSFLTQTRRSRPRAAISSDQHARIAGASCSS